MSELSELCEAIRRGEDVTQAVAQMEPSLQRMCDSRMLMEYGSRLQEMDALYDVSESVQRYWKTIYPKFQSPEQKYEAFLRFADANEQYLGIPHTESVCKLKACGWTAADRMAAYIHSRTAATVRTLSPEVAAQAAREDWDTAERILKGEGYEELFPFYDASYQIYRQFEWIDFVYYFLEYEDRSFLQKKHKSKRLCKYCEAVLARLEQGGATVSDFEKTAPCPDFSVFEGALLQQGHLMRSAAAQKLRKGNDQNGYYVMSLHLLDEARGCGAALCFEPLNKGPFYAKTTAKAKGVFFYRFSYPYPTDVIPESRRKKPEEMPAEFLRQAYRAFSMAANLEK